MIHAPDLLEAMTPESARGEVIGGKNLSEEAQEATNKWNRYVLVWFHLIGCDQFMNWTSGKPQRLIGS